jgi:excinuclease ABC subunit A
VIKQADWLIDMGPEGGDEGGAIIASGTPEHVATVEASHTGHYLRVVLGERQSQAALELVESAL